MHEPATVFPASRKGTTRDDGFTLIEVIVAFAIFLAMVSASLMILSSAQRATGDSSRRTTALNLAARELSITADTFNSQVRGPDQVQINQVSNPNALAGGTAGQPLQVDGVPFTVTRNAQWASVGSNAASTCDEGTSSELAYLRVEVRVTWPGNERPVTMNTVLTPLKGTYSDNDGHIGLKVIDAAGSPRAGQSVTISGPSGNRTASTADDGCVLFPFLTPGSYTVTLNSTGHVDILGRAPSVTTAEVQAGQLWRSTVSYDRAATVRATLVPPAGFTVPAGLGGSPPAVPIMLGNSALLPAGAAAATATSGTNPRTLTNLWPYASGYQLWAGRCLDNDPAYTAERTGQDRDDPVVVTPGDTTDANVALAGVSLVNGSGSARNNVTAIQVPVRDGSGAVVDSCPSLGTFQTKDYGAKVVLGTVNAGTTLKTSLPFGTWWIWNGTTWRGPVTLDKGAAPGSVNL